MLGKTHMMIGISAALAFAGPETVTEFFLAVGVGAAGALISDIDVGTSDLHRSTGRVVLFTVLAAVIVLGLDRFQNTGIVDKIMENSGILKAVAGCLIFIAACAFGKEQPHRSFMHSFLALIIFDFALGLILPKLVLYFTIGFLSHLGMDVLNKKKVRFLYPLKEGFCLGLFSADGLANQIFYIIGCIAAGVEMIMFAMRLIS